MAATSKNKNDTIYVSASSTKALCHYLSQLRFSPQKLNAIVGMSQDELDQPDIRVPVEVNKQLWQTAIEISDDAALGLHIGEQSKVEEMGLVGNIFFNSATLGDALIQLQRYFSLINSAMKVEVDTDQKFAYLRYICELDEAYCIPEMERTMAVSLKRAQKLIHPQLSIEQLNFAHPKPPYADEYQRIFKCSIKFRQANSAIVFKKEFLDFELPERNPYLYQILSRHIEALVSKIRPKPSLTTQVKKLISQKLAKDACDAANIADKLCMSRHTLYRHLKGEGHSFQELVEQVKKEKAIRYLESQKYTLSEIAFLLGFSELSAFSRAFKRWTGVAPAQYKKTSK